MCIETDINNEMHTLFFSDLFQAVIMQSGSPLWNDYYSNGAAREAFFKLVYAIYPNMNSNNTADMYKFLIDFTPDAIIRTVSINLP